METEYIPSGESYIAHAEHKILKALLGSCVGVALYDKANDIGGIIHLLLPEPAGRDSEWRPEVYAKSGLPLFINKLLAAGADRENLVAVTAGGALFGEVSKRDVALNIGGRTIEEVLKALSRARIPVVREETGGFSPTILQLDTASWQTEIQSNFEKAPAFPPAEFHKPTPREIEQAVKEVTPIPQAALKVIHLLSSGEYNMEEIAKTLMADQVLGAKVLSLCNSSFFGTRRPIDSLEEALLILGEGYLIEVMVSAAINAFAAQHKGGYSLQRGGLYKHAVAVAYTAKVIAQTTGGSSPGTAYTAGLLHDIGKVVLDQYFAQFKPNFYKDKFNLDGDMTTLEKSFLDLDHQLAGKKLAESWGLPETIIQTIASHHRPQLDEEGGGMVCTVYLADLLANWFLAGLEYDRINSEPLFPILCKLQLTPRELPAIIERVPWGELMYL